MRARWPWPTFILLSLVGSCRQLLDIEPARLDDASSGAVPSSGGSAPDGAGGVVQSYGGTGEVSSGNAGVPVAAAGSPAAAGSSASEMGGAGSGGVDGAEPPLCERYCMTLVSNCTGDHAQYPDYLTCIDTCAILPAGSPGDTDVDSVECRLALAEKAGRLEPEFYCPLSGPVGGNECGSDCEGFCRIMAAFCSAERTNGEYYYPDEATCLADCATLPVAPEPYSSTLHSVGPYLQCRVFHACAANIDADYHCGHAFGEPPCDGP